MSEIITGDGRIFRSNGDGTYTERINGMYASEPVSAEAMKEMEEYCGVENEELNACSSSHPNFLGMFWDKSN